ncbi:hypothetical protein G7K_6714-t1 [Saitoella complicata NRRL Y-17804]|uniref:Uncharacterized protein n=1 Tax=Saitoella complicata (strain BCRC 22490 / CBS 7301 / JCM 7358 / NBRC 10748 / NRRL Y-17804) TaxID=698492 RepID=A0A0E9NRY2_SAICN|nr:hypothetical protein G7K_6714-t1 [Saitoella complicata NRRL Y-17804]
MTGNWRRLSKISLKPKFINSDAPLRFCAIDAFGTVSPEPTPCKLKGERKRVHFREPLCDSSRTDSFQRVATSLSLFTAPRGGPCPVLEEEQGVGHSCMRDDSVWILDLIAIVRTATTPKATTYPDSDTHSN